MFKSWFLCSVKYDKTMESGMQKKVTEQYLVDALSFTEAESRIIQEVTPFITGEFSIANIKRAKYSELFFNDQADRWYKCKVNFITLDEKSGNEKKTSTYMLVQAIDLDNAKKTLKEGMQGTLADWEEEAVIEIKILDVFVFSKAE